MSTLKRNLTKADVAKHLPRAEQLRSSGVDVEIPEEWQPGSRVLGIEIATPPVSLVWDLPGGGVYYVVGVRLLATQSGVTLQQCEIAVHWDDQVVLQSFDEGNPDVKFGGHLYRQSEILNQRIENYLRLDCGHFVEGWLLGRGLRPIPLEYSNGAIVPFKLTFEDQFGSEFWAKAELSVLRTAKLASPAQRPRTGLLDPGEDPEWSPVSTSPDSSASVPLISRKRAASSDADGVKRK